MLEYYTVTISYDDSLVSGEGPCVRETWLNKGVLHRSNGPAIIVRHPKTGATIREEYYENGLRHRIDGPAEIEHDIDTGVAVSERWVQRGFLHRIGAPALILRDRLTGEVELQGEYFEGTLKGDYNYKGPSDEPAPS